MKLKVTYQMTGSGAVPTVNVEDSQGRLTPIINFSNWDGNLCINRPTVDPDIASHLNIKLNRFSRMATYQELPD